jgi:V8-like Glu-specific endopeptidase
MADALVDKVLHPSARIHPEAGQPPRDKSVFGRPERATPSAPSGERRSEETYDVIVGHPLHVVPDPRAYPFSAIALLTMTFETGATGQGTGWFFSPSRIATAAHNLIHPRAGRATNMLIQPGWNGVDALDQLAVSSTLVAPNWAGRWNEDDDWAIIGTDHTAASGVGWFGYQAYDNGYPSGMVLNVSGYPADTYGASGDLVAASLAGSGFQYMDSGYLASVTPTQIGYTISTAAGMSGGPVFITPGSSRYAIGIHTQGLVTTNAGRRIDNQLLGILNTCWAR